MSYDLKTLLAELKSKEWSDRTEALRKLEVLGDKKAAPDVAQTLRDDSQYVRMTAARVLGTVGDESSVPALLAVMQGDNVAIVRQNALWALGTLGAVAKQALPELEKLTESTARLTQADMTVAQLAQTAVARINKSIAEAEAAAAAPAEGEEAAPALNPEEEAAKAERLARREAALARKRAREQGQG